MTFGVLYLLSALAATSAADNSKTSTYNSGTGTWTTSGGSNPDGALFVPAIGPFIQMANTSSATGNLVLVVDGVGQSLGLALLAYGIFSPKTVLVRNDLAKATIVPVAIGKDGYGAGLHVEF